VRVRIAQIQEGELFFELPFTPSRSLMSARRATTCG
jgi:hypothetical protein